MEHTFTKHEKAGLTYFTIPAFDKTGLVIHAFSGRTGGVSSETYASLNMGIFTNEPLENVLENRRRLCDVLGIQPSHLVAAHQVHSDRILSVTKQDRGRGAIDRDSVIPATDALMTNEKDVPLIGFFADCVPVIFLDPIRKAVAIAHAGWKGTVAKIAAKTVKAMEQAYQTSPRDLLAAVGPSIGACHYQVDEPVIEKVKEAFPTYWDRLLTNTTPDGHAQLNLWEANARQLMEAGVPEGQITITSLCTFCHPELLFSHRRGMAGRHSALIMLK